MYVVTTEVAPHVRVSKAFDRASLFKEPRSHRRERLALNRHARKGWANFNPAPRLRQAVRGPQDEPELQVIDLGLFKQSRPVVEVEEVGLPDLTVRSFDAREQAALQAGL
jgi:hypothetical protein